MWYVVVREMMMNDDCVNKGIQNQSHKGGGGGMWFVWVDELVHIWGITI